MKEELRIDCEVTRPLWVMENFFNSFGFDFHEIAFYFLLTTPQELVSKGNSFEEYDGKSKLTFKWHQIKDLDTVDLYPESLRKALNQPAEFFNLYHSQRLNPGGLIMENVTFRTEMNVRDYELDIQGIVNNSVYQNYLEHARHEYIKTIGIDFKEYAQKGINFVVIRAELDYKFPLTSGDRFWVDVRMGLESPVKIAFFQEIYRVSDGKLILKGKIIATALNSRGRPQIPDEVKNILLAVENKESQKN